MADIVRIDAASNAADLGLRALADLAAAASGKNYRIIGGHMVHILSHVYPTAAAVARVTADADAGMDAVVAGGADLHANLLARGYRRVRGNHYQAPSGDDTPLAVDLLVPLTTGRRMDTVYVGEHGFDAIPGLSLALAAPPVEVSVHAHLHRGDTLIFDALVPDVEAAVVLKALAWHSRSAAKDVADLCSLMAIVHEHKVRLTGWKLGTAQSGTRGDAARALYVLVAMIDRQQRIDGLTMPAARLGALVRAHIREPVTGR
ncbi:hypothetical protein ACFWAY_34815 [Rhodococcus sp. NPDC059968]|uniref:hypothetical protein n=1 Tax=Rhodococcus sp. NPDC059968 TaxID=3347017 RepID=UPI00366E6F27